MDCVRCKGNVKSQFACGRKFCPILTRFSKFSPKTIDLNFSGSSPPDIFVGRFNYPKVFTGILSPTQHDEESNKLSSPEEWFRNNMSINDILKNRGSLVYSRFASDIKGGKGRLLDTMQELSMANKPCDVEFFLKKKPKVLLDLSAKAPPIGNPAPLVKADLMENPKIPRRVDYLVSDNHLKAVNAIIKLHKKDHSVTSMIKLLSSGLLGLKPQRRLVPSRWSTTAVDDIISKNLVKQLYNYPWINDYLLFHGEYVGNHYEIILIPRQWSFEVIEAKAPGSCWNTGSKVFFCCDDENYKGRKTYAFNVSGAYYCNRLAIAEYLNSIKRQASILVMREVRDEYFAPLGVGILREVTRSVFKNKPERFDTLNEAIAKAGTRMIIPVSEYVKNSNLLKEIRAQKTLFSF